MNPETRYTRRELHRKERRARKQQDCTLTATLRAVEDLDDWVDDDGKQQEE